MIERVRASRYVTPLREGGSLPGVVEADDLGTYVVKFRGAGQGVKVLVAEVVVAELARTIGLRVPDLKAVDLDAVIAKYEADEEVQDLLTASVGLNLGVDFLPGAFGFDAHTRIDSDYAATVLWLDALTANVDRSWRNPNLLVWHGNVWCIDHGAALYFHHAWPAGSPEQFAKQPYDATAHVLGRHRDRVPLVSDALAERLDDLALRSAVDAVPDEWLGAEADLARVRYIDYLRARLANREGWLPRAEAA
ncbi:MAG TPA: HipA family kinase [Nocardioidaceae bacterium]|nr:HipA family kinase [Nocardioidaceae bacterium]